MSVFKQLSADFEGKKPAYVNRTPEETNGMAICCVCGSIENIRVCGGCKSARYCSKTCQKRHYESHSVWCHAIEQLVEVEKDKIYSGKSVRGKQIDYKTTSKMARLVGQKPLLNCYLNGKLCSALWDTGSMISLVDRYWLGASSRRRVVTCFRYFG